MKYSSIRQSNGATMIEVLVTIFVVAFALLGLSKFQSLLFVAGSYAKERAVAAQLAQAKLDDLRSFVLLTSGTGVFGYANIGNDAGGALSGGGLAFPSGLLDEANVTYHRSWAVSNYYFCSGVAPSQTNCPSPNVKSIPDFKTVSVLIKWADPEEIKKGTDLDLTSSTYCDTYPRYCLRVTGAIYPSDPALAARGIAGGYAVKRPNVGYRPIGVPDSVPIDIGGGVKRESSKPLPDVSSKGLSTAVSFDSISYSPLGAGFSTDSREEYTTVNCICEFTASGTGYTPARWVYETGKGLVMTLGVQASSRATGRAVTISGDSQDPLCDKCCRDHHDVSDNTKPLYDPERSSVDFSGGDHNHYYYSNPSDPSAGLVLVSNTPGQRYLEACRFVRYPEVPDVTKDFSGSNWLTLEADDEFYRSWWVFQDWRLVDLALFSYAYLQDSTKLNLYQDFVKGAVGYDLGLSGYSSAPSKGSLTGRNFNLNAGQTAQLISRSVYVDKVYGKANPRVLDSAYLAYLATLSDADWLRHVAFYEVNTTLLLDWSSDQVSRVAVTSQDIRTVTDPDAGYYTNYYSRGLVTGGETAGAAVISVNSRTSNSGLTGGTTRKSPSVGIDAADNASSLSDNITVTRSGGSTLAISGEINVANRSVVYSQVVITPTGGGGVTCGSIQSISSTLASYSCTVPSGWSGSLVFSGPGGYGFGLAGDSNPPGTTLTLTYSGVTTAQTGQNLIAYGPFSRVEGSITQITGGKGQFVSFSGSGCTPVKPTDTTYYCQASRGWSGTITASSSNGDHVVSPTSRSYSNVNADILNQNYTVTK